MKPQILKVLQQHQQIYSKVDVKKNLLFCLLPF